MLVSVFKAEPQFDSKMELHDNLEQDTEKILPPSKLDS